MAENSIHRQAIESQGGNFSVVKKIYITYPPDFFVGNEDLQFDIFDEISKKFKVPLSAVRVAGSAHLGYSFHKKRPFITGESDLDIAIISAELFQRYLEICYEESNGFSPDQFRKDDQGRSTRNQFLNYSGRGIIRPDLMPKCHQKQDVWSFFNALSVKHNQHFKSISAGFYISEAIYLLKQRNSLNSTEVDIV